MQYTVDIIENNSSNFVQSTYVHGIIIGLNTVFLGNYLCINSGSSLTNCIKSEGVYERAAGVYTYIIS
jgi:hypothetical protein